MVMAMRTTKQRATLRTAPDMISQRVSFDCNGTLTGESETWSNVGRLPERFCDGYFAARNASDFYVVKSYATPIAWYAHGAWTVPAVKYSPTTSRHMAAVRRGIAIA